MEPVLIDYSGTNVQLPYYVDKTQILEKLVAVVDPESAIERKDVTIGLMKSIFI